MFCFFVKCFFVGVVHLEMDIQIPKKWFLLEILKIHYIYHIYIYGAPPKIYLFKFFLSSKIVFFPEKKTLFFLRRLVALHLNSRFKMPIPILGGGTI